MPTLGRSELQHCHIVQLTEPAWQGVANAAEKFASGNILAVEHLGDAILVGRIVGVLLNAKVGVDCKCSGDHDFLSFKKTNHKVRFDNRTDRLNYRR